MSYRTMIFAALSAVTVSCLSSENATMAADWFLTENPELDQFFRAEVARIERENSLLNYATREQWEAAKSRLRAELYDMLGLNPVPTSTPLKPLTTGVVHEKEFRVEQVQFQSRPGLYVTGNLYLPAEVTEALPAVLYVCGHAPVKKDGISFGNKAHYQHHGAWFARNGYVCLVIDTLQLGEIEAIHHGTYRYDRWWWNSRGYTPAGVEAWNCIRALDYLQSRPEVDDARLGVTGRSGGGAYSWWLAALDDRITCAVPVAGITSLRNHVVDGCVEGHCDCMYMLNSMRWDYATVAALVAPRPLLISNTDRDAIFPLEGVVDVHRQVRHIYELYGQPEKLGLQITAGPHHDTQELHLHAFRWMNQHLRKSDEMVTIPAVPFFQPEQLRVYSELPADEINTTIDELFVEEAAVPSASAVSGILDDPLQWTAAAGEVLRSRCFRAWPQPDTSELKPNEYTLTSMPLAEDLPQSLSDLRVTRVTFQSQEHVSLFVDLVHRQNVTSEKFTAVQLLIADDQAWTDYQRLLAPADGGRQSEPLDPLALAILEQFATPSGSVIAICCPRGIGPHAWKGDAKKQTQIQRRFQLLGRTVDGMRVWDIRRAMQTVRSIADEKTSVVMRSAGRMDLLCVCASLFEPPLEALYLTGANLSREQRPSILNQSRVLHEQELVGHAAVQTDVHVPASCEFAGFARTLTAMSRWQGHKVIDEPRFDTR